MAIEQIQGRFRHLAVRKGNIGKHKNVCIFFVHKFLQENLKPCPETVWSPFKMNFNETNLS